MNAVVAWLPGMQPLWERVDKFDRRAIRVVDGHLPDGRELGPHYSRRTPDSDQVMPPGETLLLLAGDGLAAWAVCHNYDPSESDTRRWRCTVFRNEGPHLSSDLIRAATALTYWWWRTNYAWPSVPLETEVNPDKVRRKRDPGRCFLRAGWTADRCVISSRLLVLRAPPEVP